MRIAIQAAARSTCDRKYVGAVIVRDKTILSTGYNGAPKGFSHCTEDTCIRKQMSVPSGQRHELCRGLHEPARSSAEPAGAPPPEQDLVLATYHQKVLCVSVRCICLCTDDLLDLRNPASAAPCPQPGFIACCSCCNEA